MLSTSISFLEKTFSLPNNAFKKLSIFLNKVFLTGVSEFGF